MNGGGRWLPHIPTVQCATHSARITLKVLDFFKLCSTLSNIIKIEYVIHDTLKTFLVKNDGGIPTHFIKDYQLIIQSIVDMILCLTRVLISNVSNSLIFDLFRIA